MIYISFECLDGTPNYAQFGGIHLFNNTQVIDGKCVGYFNGELQEGMTLADPVVVTEYRKQLSKREFLGLFEPPEHRAVKTAAKTDDIVDQLWDILMVADTVDLEYQQTIDGMGYLVVAGILTQARHDEITKGKPV